MMRTTRSTVRFHDPFTLNREVGELPAGCYDIETDEEDIGTLERATFRRTAICFYVENQRSTRMLVIDPGDLESALSRDAEKPGRTPFTGRQ